MSNPEEFERADHGGGGGGGTSSSNAGSEAIKWSAIVIIVLAILWFLARFVIPLIG